MAVKKTVGGAGTTTASSGSAKTKAKSNTKAAKTKAAKAKAAEDSDAVESKSSTAAASKAKKTVAPDAIPPAEIDDLDLPQIFPMDKVSEVRAPTQSGQVFRLDGGFLDALRMQVRRVVDEDGKPGIRMSFRISGPSRADFEERLKKKSAKEETFSYPEAEPKKKGKDIVLAYSGKDHPIKSSYSTHSPSSTSSSADKALVLEGKNWRFQFMPNDGPQALRGYARLRITGSDAEINKELKKVVDKLGLQVAFAPPTPTSVRRYALMKLLWRVAPAEAKKLSGKGPLSDLKVATVEKALKDAGISQKRMDGLRYEEVCPGHFTVMDPELGAEMKKAGLKYAYSTVTSPEHVLSIITEGQKATLTRWAEGMLIQGMSSMSDVGSGGAEGVFSRLVTPKGHDRGWTGRTYKIILRPELLERTDIWGWNGDYFGRSWDLETKNFGAQLVKSVEDSNYTSNNEIISPVGNDPRFMACVVATSEPNRKTLIEYLKKQKFKPPDGRSLEDFVVLSPKIDQDLLKKLKSPPAKKSTATTKKTAKKKTPKAS